MRDSVKACCMALNKLNGCGTTITRLRSVRGESPPLVDQVQVQVDLLVPYSFVGEEEYVIVSATHTKEEEKRVADLGQLAADVGEVKLAAFNKALRLVASEMAEQMRAARPSVSNRKLRKKVLTAMTSFGASSLFRSACKEI